MKITRILGDEHQNAGEHLGEHQNALGEWLLLSGVFERPRVLPRDPRVFGLPREKDRERAIVRKCERNSGAPPPPSFRQTERLTG